MSASPESLALLQRAAELRAAGTPWADAATRLAVTHDELRRLVAEHNHDYDRLVRRARAELLRETLDEAVAALRGMIKSPDTRVGYLAATTLVRYELARLRYGTKEARERLDYDTSTRGQKRVAADAETTRVPNMSESSEVPNQQKVAAPTKMAQPTVPGAPVSPKPATATPPTAPGKPAPPVAATGPIPSDERERRRRLLLNDFARGRGAPLAKDDRLDLEIGRLLDGLPADGK